MKTIGKVLLTLLLLLVLLVVIAYLLLQTSWGAKNLSRWVSDNSQYQLSLGKIDHDWSQPGLITFSEVIISQSNKPVLLNAEQVVFGLSWRQITEPRHFRSLLLQQGSLNLDAPSPTLNIQADTLRLSNMALNIASLGSSIQGKNITGGIIPWQPKAGDRLGENNQFQFSADELTFGGNAFENVFVQGTKNKQALKLTNFGANIAKGELTGEANREQDGRWQVEHLRLSNVRLQTAKTLDDLWHSYMQLPPLTVKRFDLIDARVEGNNWAFNDLDLTLKNVAFEKGDWRSADGELTLNAGDIIKGDIHLIDPMLTLELSDSGAAIKQFSTRWQNGLIRSAGIWNRANHQLQLNELAVVSLEYTLPANWRQLWQKSLPSWLAEVQVNKLSASRNLLIDINPDFPFQLTALDGFGSNLVLAKHSQWGVWSGSLTLNAGNATFNRNDLRRPSLALTANDQRITFSDLSAFTSEGLLEAKAEIGQTTERPFSLTLTGRSVDVNLLHNWGWPKLPFEGKGNLNLQLKGSLAQSIPFKSSLSGSLKATENGGQQVNQMMQAGEVNAVTTP
ncbi:AsmA family protein [Yersinia nurmii]|uniref:AsmA family protein n=1 Tax=Yersinia nurmii TaxID=685706 RepID=A0AAW7KA94_9GAMM|nr:AsmA family protein [Yersinia nurmii]MDN0088470.1 AsmA family protein [Yersinia nurmii]